MNLGSILEKSNSHPISTGEATFYHLLLKEVVDYAIIGLDTEGHIDLWNAGAERIKGYTEQEILGQSASIFYTPEDRPRFAALLQTAKTQGRIQDEGWRVRKDGEKFWAYVVITALHDESGKHVGYAKITRDLTEQKKLDQMKTDFVSFASHQLKTPLAEIYGFIEGLLGGLTGKPNEKQLRYLQKAEATTASALQLVSDLLNISRIERGLIHLEPHPAKLRDVVQDAINPYRRDIEAKGLDLTFHEKDKNIVVFCDFQKTVEALKNIIDNAVKFTDHGVIRVTISSENGKAIVEITDTGTGIDNVILRRLFTREMILEDTTNQRGGSGLGLYIAKSFLNLQGGSIVGHSIVGSGTSFLVTLPEDKKEGA